MDLATIIGLVAAFGLVLGSIAAGGGLAAFIDVPSLFIVLGGTVGAVLINFPLQNVTGAMKVAMNAFKFKSVKPDQIINEMVNYSNMARRDGILALEEVSGSTPDKFLAKGLQLAVDGQDTKDIEKILETEIEYIKHRHKLGADVFTAFGTFFPALGLIGTLIGLVGMLQNMDDPSSIGPNMAIALLTTFYGAVFANLVCLPIAGKLKNRDSEEVLIKELVLEGILAISAGDNPRVVEQKLHSYLSPKFRISQF